MFIQLHHYHPTDPHGISSQGALGTLLGNYTRNCIGKLAHVTGICFSTRACQRRRVTSLRTSIFIRTNGSMGKLNCFESRQDSILPTSLTTEPAGINHQLQGQLPVCSPGNTTSRSTQNLTQVSVCVSFSRVISVTARWVVIDL